MKKHIALLISGLIGVSVLYFYFCGETVIFALSDFFKKSSYFSVDFRIKREIGLWGFEKIFVQYCVGALVEELQFRSPVLIVSLFLIWCHQKYTFRILNQFNQYIILWIVTVGTSFVWAQNHPYGYVVNYIIFFGGLVNGACIIYAPNDKKWLGMLCAILLHMLVNSVVIIGIYCIHFLS